ncbi:hypothetical protein PROFUN_08856 [Planoprotostelium fungivorum]|uniref:non-specific serine/threonine protein kinase n=1 Tax=Planoprotostelium fungivorum TaxID=1890364 RepID=A0A2P6NJ13_9EUKA|nr:hypothetical protein PROFUN_08856 [Planoprotostelium fungivorum]
MAEFSLTWEEIARLHQVFAATAGSSATIRKEAGIVDVLKRAEIGVITKSDLESFYQHLGCRPGDTVNFAMLVDGVCYFGAVKGRRQQKSSGLRKFTASDIYSIYQLFCKVDTDNNGCLSAKELFTCLKAVDPTINAKEVSALMKRLEVQQHATISFAQFVKGIAYGEKALQMSLEKFIRDNPKEEKVIIPSGGVPPPQPSQSPQNFSKKNDLADKDVQVVEKNEPVKKVAPALKLNLPPTRPVTAKVTATPRKTAIATPRQVDTREATMKKDEMVSRAIRVFNAADADGNGTIDIHELHELLRLILGLDLTVLRHHHQAPNAYEWEIPFVEIELKDKLGEGSFGVVYKAKWRGAEVACKELKTLANVSSDVVEEFQREIAMMGKLRHPNIILYMGASTKPPNMCMITEYMDGGSVYDLIHKRKAGRSSRGSSDVLQTKLNMKETLYILKQTAFGLNYLHLSNIIHRDLKSMNLLIDKALKVKICDFGLSCVKLKGQELIEQVGSPLWMSPELLLGQPYDEKVDTYSFGIVMWEIVARKIPYQGMSLPELISAVGKQGKRPSVPAESPSVLSTLIRKCWSHKIISRPDLATIIADLERVSYLMDTGELDENGMETKKKTKTEAAVLVPTKKIAKTPAVVKKA